MSEQSLSQPELSRSEMSPAVETSASETPVETAPLLWEEEPPPLLRKLIDAGDMPAPAPKQRHRDDSPTREPVRRTRPPMREEKLQAGRKYRLFSSRIRAYITDEVDYAHGRVVGTLPKNYFPRMLGIFNNNCDNIQLHHTENGVKKSVVAEIDLGEIDAREDFTWHDTAPSQYAGNDSSEDYSEGGSFAHFLEGVTDSGVGIVNGPWQLLFEVDEKRTKLKLVSFVYKKMKNDWSELFE